MSLEEILAQSARDLDVVEQCFVAIRRSLENPLKQEAFEYSEAHCSGMTKTACGERRCRKLCKKTTPGFCDSHGPNKTPRRKWAYEPTPVPATRVIMQDPTPPDTLLSVRVVLAD